MISNSPTSRSLNTRAPTGKARRALFVGVPVGTVGEPILEASQDSKNMANQDALRHIPVAAPIRSPNAQRVPTALAVADVDPEFQHRVVRVTERFSESLVLLGNEPSLGLYRLQEHARRSMPVLVDRKRELEQINQQVQGVCFDTEYAGSVVRDMHSISQFSNVQELLNKCVHLKQCLDQAHLPANASSATEGDVHRGTSPGPSRSTASRPVAAAAGAGVSALSPLSNPLSSSAVSSTPPSAKLLPGLSAEGALKALQQKKASDSLDLRPKQF